MVVEGYGKEKKREGYERNEVAGRAGPLLAVRGSERATNR